jgi:antitoxin (DNA-binding transcriptional repressor) of toxin-antitoxin stability system
MKKHNIDIRQLRDTRKLKAWLRAGKTVELRERDKVIACIVPPTQQEAPGELPDFAARRKNRSSTDRSHSKSPKKDSGPLQTER